jgi:transposase
MPHETLWITKDIGKAPTPGYCPIGTGADPEPGGAPGAGVGGLCVPMAASLADGGEEALASKPVPGRPRKLTAQQREQLVHILLQGARAHGFANELWTIRRIAAVIRVHFGVRYHPAHVWKVLRSLGWSCQVPERQAIQRDEQAIAHWKRYKWPAIKKSPTTWRPSGVSR